MRKKREDRKPLTAQPVGASVFAPVKAGPLHNKRPEPAVISVGNGCYRRMPTCKD